MEDCIKNAHVVLYACIIEYATYAIFTRRVIACRNEYIQRHGLNLQRSVSEKHRLGFNEKVYSDYASL